MDRMLKNVDPVEFTLLRGMASSMLAAEYHLAPSRIDVEQMSEIEDDLKERLINDPKLFMSLSTVATYVAQNICQYMPAPQLGSDPESGAKAALTNPSR